MNNKMLSWVAKFVFIADVSAATLLGVYLGDRAFGPSGRVPGGLMAGLAMAAIAVMVEED